MNNYNKVLEAQGIASTSAGLAQERYSTYLDNIEAATNRSKAAFEKFAAVSFSEQTQIMLANVSAGFLNFGAAIGGLTPILISLVGVLFLVKAQMMATVVVGLIDFFKNTTFSIIGFRLALQEITMVMTGTKVASLALGTAISTILGPIAIIGSLAFMAFNYFNSQIEKTSETVKRLESEISELDSSLTIAFQNKKILGSIGNEFETLRQNTKKTVVEQERFIELQNKIKDIMPEISGHYDTQGDFILEESVNLEKLNAERVKEIELMERKKQSLIESEFDPKTDLYRQALEKTKEAERALSRAKAIKAAPGGIDAGGNRLFISDKELEKARIAYEVSVDELQDYAKELKNNWILLSQDKKDIQEKILLNQGEWGKSLVKQLKDFDIANTMKYYLNATPEGYENVKLPPPFDLAETQKLFEDLMSLLTSVPDRAREINQQFKETGEITAEQAESLRGIFGEDYVDMVYSQNGALKLNTEEMHKAIMAKAEDAIATLELIRVNDPLNTQLAKQIELLKTQRDILASRSYLDAIQDKKKVQEELLKITLEYLKQEANAKKDALQKELDEYKNMIDAKKDAIEKAAEAEKERIQDQMDNYKKIIDAEIELLDQKKKTDEYNESVASKNKEISDIDAQLLALQFDNSEAAKAKRLQLEADRVAKTKELTKFQNDYAVTNQKEALQKEYKNYEDSMKKRQDIVEKNMKEQKESLDRQYKEFETNMKGRIAQIDEYLKESGSLTIEAMGLLSSKSDDFYKKLLEWNKKFGDGVQTDIIQKLQLAFGILAQLQANGSYGFGTFGTGGYTGGGAGGAGGKPAVAYHSGGLVGNNVPKLKDGEEFAKLMRGEVVSTPNQIANFMNKILPSIAKSGDSFGETKIELTLNVAGNLDKSCIPDLKETVLKVINDAMRNRGTKRDSFSYSV